jgi:phage terminase large subunit GpA-like protein
MSAAAWLTALVPECLARAFAARSALTVTEWARKNVYLDKEASPTSPGYYDPDLTPYAASIADGFLDPEFKEDHTVKSTQVGITEVILNIIRYCAAERPTNTIYAIDSQTEAKKIGRIRLVPSLKANAATAAAISENEDDLTSLTLYLVGMVVYLLGSHAAGAFENKPAGLVILDELEKHKVSPGQSTTVDVARQRLKTVRNRKLYSISKPDEEDGVSWQEYLTGTRDKYFVACPTCAFEQELIWEQVRFSQCKDLAGDYDLAQVLTDTTYECANALCAAHWNESTKRATILAAARRPDQGWRRTNFDKGKLAPVPGKRSRQISDLYSLFPGSTMGEMAVEFIGCGKNPGKLKNFRNGRLGLPSVTQSGEVKESYLLRLRGNYTRGQLPIVPCFCAETSDVQGDVKKLVKAGFAPNGDIYVTDYRYTLSFDELTTEATTAPIHCLADGQDYFARLILVDEGFLATDARDFAQRSCAVVPTFTSKGRGGIQVRHTVAESKMIHRGEPMIAYHYDDDAIKKELYLSSIRDVIHCLDALARNPHDTLAAAKLERLPRIWFPSDMEPEFYTELTAEKLVRDETAAGYNKWVWIKDPTKANDFGDATKMLKVIWHVVGPMFAEQLAAAKAITKP